MGVDPLVLGEESAVTEGLPAPLAPKRLLATVDTLVAVQRGEPSEGTAALPAGVQLLASVRVAVLRQLRELAERAAALPATLQLRGRVTWPGAPLPSWSPFSNQLGSHFLGSAT